jgi:hypothetical protein
MQNTDQTGRANGMLARASLACSGLLLCQALVGMPGASGESKPPAEGRAPALTPARFEKLNRLIKPQPGELRFHEIPWLIDVWEARRKAAAEGKPILVWSGAGGAPVGVC